MHRKLPCVVLGLNTCSITEPLIRGMSYVEMKYWDMLSEGICRSDNCLEKCPTLFAQMLIESNISRERRSFFMDVL